MGWNVSLVAVKARTMEDLLSDPIALFTLTGRFVSADDAITSRLSADLAVADINGWCFIAQPGGDLAVNGEILERLSQGTQALGLLLASASSLYAFRLHEDGQERRWIVYVDDEVAEEHGAALPVETDIERPDWGYDEAWAFTLLQRLTGLTWTTLQQHRFRAAVLNDPRAEAGAPGYYQHLDQ